MVAKLEWGRRRRLANGDPSQPLLVTTAVAADTTQATSTGRVPIPSENGAIGRGETQVRLRYLLTVPWAKPRLRATARCDMPTL